ncbi:hypothetical protein [Brevundimonas sp.]|uniref:hypothetical protein n=1 Tax=Brevundimonas sp. TaxID=1871086 RepID=UPI0035B142B5
MTRDPDDWSDLSRTWTEPGGAPAPDARLIRAVRRRDLIARLNFYGEVGGAIVAAGLFLWLAVDSQIGWPPASVAVGFCAFALVLTLWARRAAPPVLDDTPAEAVRTALDQARAGARWGWCGLAVTAAAGVTLASMYLLEPIPDRLVAAVAAGGLALAAFAVGYGVHIRRCRRRIDRHQRALSEMDAG